LRITILFSFFFLVLVPQSKCNLLDSLKLQQMADSLITLSDNTYNTGDLKGAILEREKALVFLKNNQNWEDLVMQWNVLYVANELDDNPNGIELAIDSALYYSEKYLFNTSVSYLNTISNIGDRELRKSNYNQAIGYFENAVSGYEAAGADLKEYFPVLTALLRTYTQKGKINLSNELAHVYLEKVKRSPLENRFGFISELSKIIGKNYFNEKKYASAKSILEFGLDSNEKTVNHETKLFNDILLKSTLAEVLMELDGGAHCSDALRIFRSFNENDLKRHGLYTATQRDIGEILIRLDSNELGKSHLFNAYNTYNSRKVKKGKNLSNYASKLANSYLKLGELDSSLVYFNKAVSLFEMEENEEFNNLGSYNKVPNFTITNVKTLSGYAEVNLKLFVLQNNIIFKDKALASYRQAFNGAKFLQKELSSKHSKYILNKNLQEHYPAYFSLLLEIYNEENSQETFQEILQLIEDNKAVVLKEDVQEKLALMSSQIPEELLDKDIEFKEELNTLKRKIHDFKPKNEEDEAVVNNWKEEQLQVTRDYSDHQKYLEDNYPEYFKTKYEIQTINLEVLRDELDGDQAFLSFYQTEENWYCAWVTKESEGIHTAGKPENVKNDLEEVLRILRNNPLDNFQASDRNDFKSSAYSLYAELIPKALENKSSFIISQIGELNYLPFEVLLTSDKTEDLGFSDLPYLIKDKEIQYASSAELWLSSKKTKSKNLELAAVSFAPFTEGAATDQRNCVADAKMSALACTKKELDYISDHVASKSYFSQDASLANFQTMDAASIIHLATHACLDDADDAFNKLIFYDDYLSIQDLESMRLNADLAVLSACNTGSGQMKAGEGVIHLGKAFRAAGVSSLITSLWSINDCATADIVGNFYGHLGKENISTALRTAKLDYLKDSNKLLAHPHFWAGLTFSGNAEVLSKDSSLGFLVPIIACLAVILAFFFFRRRN